KKVKEEVNPNNEQNKEIIKMRQERLNYDRKLATLQQDYDNLEQEIEKSGAIVPDNYEELNQLNSYISDLKNKKNDILESIRKLKSNSKTMIQRSDELESKIKENE